MTAQSPTPARLDKVAATVPPGPWPGAHLTLDRIADLRKLDAAAFVAAGRR